MIDLEKLAVKSLVEHNGELIFSKEKFAELIVRECMAVANTYQNRGGNCYVDDMIAKHFGVEL